MFENLKGIEIGRIPFKKNTELMLFKNKELQNNIASKKSINDSTHHCLIYGKNGSGKTTISRCIKDLSNNYETESKLIYIDEKRSAISDEKNNIFVFNEDFIEQNIKIEENALKTIVILGKQVDLTNEIEEAEEKFNDINVKLETERALYEKNYDNEKSFTSPKYHIKEMQNKLKGDDNWAGRDRKIRDNKTNTVVNAETYKRFKTNYFPGISRDELIIEFNMKIADLNDVRTGKKKINFAVPNIEVQYDDESAKKMMEEKIERPILSEREKYLIELVDKGEIDKLNDIKNTFIKGTRVCPYCFQSVEENYGNNLVQSIEKVLTKEVDNHIAELNRIISDMEKILKEDLANIDLNLYNCLSPEFETCQKNLDVLNKKINGNLELVNKKINQPYVPIFEYQCLSSDINQLKKSLEKLEDSRQLYNEKITDVEPIIANLNKINNSIAFYDINDNIKYYKKYIQEDRVKKSDIKTLKEQHDKAEKKLKNLNEERKNVKIAVDVINEGLQYIFFKKDRLQIKCTNDSYEILSNGVSVEPKNISVGERNAIALCYFFTTIMENCDKNKRYKNNCFLVIDDPVSSFDMENKIGILSYLRYKISRFYNGNEQSKILIMTHDLSVYYELEKIFADIGSGKITNKYELVNRKLKKFESRKKHRDEYTTLVNNIYEYAENADNAHELMIGNMMRQVLEAFVTFEYKMGITDVSTNKTILKILEEKDPKYKIYFENLMYRLVLHGGSHRETQIHTMNDMNFFEIISSEEKQRTAKDIICYLYLLNKNHLLSHLGYYNGKNRRSDYESEIKEWCENILR